MADVPADFPWRAGMLLVSDDPNRSPLRMLSDAPGEWGSRWVGRPGGETYLRSGFFLGFNYGGIDSADPSTVGAMLAVVREAWACPTLWVWWSTVEGWVATRGDGDRIGQGATEADALLAAWNARPTVPR